MQPNQNPKDNRPATAFEMARELMHETSSLCDRLRCLSEGVRPELNAPSPPDGPLPDCLNGRLAEALENLHVALVHFEALEGKLGIQLNKAAEFAGPRAVPPVYEKAVKDRDEYQRMLAGAQR